MIAFLNLEKALSYKSLKPIDVPPVESSESMDDIVIGAATHNVSILEHNLSISPAITSGAFQLIVERNSPSASVAYNKIIDRSDAPIIVLAHHDVYLPQGWDTLLRERLAEVSALDPNWAVIAPFGIGVDRHAYGPVWSSSLGAIAGRVATGPKPVQSVDELMIVLRRGSGLRFDETLPSFHLYGTDIVQTALSRGMGAYAMSLPVVHNDGFKSHLDDSFTTAYRHQSRKWRSRLPINTPITRISWHGLSLLRSQMSNWRSNAFRQSIAAPIQKDPRFYAALCGWGDLTPPPRDIDTHQFGIRP